MSTRTKLELTWIGKENRPRLEPRILLEDPEKSHHAAHRVTDHDLFDNRLIFGDNLLALKALEQECAGKVKCVFIDPPYNTGSAFIHYDDGVAHSIWLSLMRDRLEVKMKSEMDSPEVLAKQQAAVAWCGYASDHAKTCGGKPWRYALIAHDVITENMSLATLVGSGFAF